MPIKGKASPLTLDMNSHRYLIAIMVIAIQSLRLEAEVPLRMVDAVGEAESRNTPGSIGDQGSALSAFQIWESAWHDANQFRVSRGQDFIPRRSWNDHELSRQICKSILEMHEARMIKDGIKPTPTKLYLAYSMGYAGAKKISFSPAYAPAVKRKGLSRFLSAYSR